MPRSRSVIAVAIGLILLAIIIGFIAAKVLDGLVVVRSRYDEYQEDASAKSQKAAAEIQAKCQIGLAPADWSEQCLSEQIHAYTEEHDRNQDLKAQQDMAYWAYAMFLASAVGLGVSAVGLVALFVSLSQTRRAISDAREIGEAQTRAYLSIVSVTVVVAANEAKPDALNFKIDVTVRNAGSSTARDLHIIIRSLFGIECIAMMGDIGPSSEATKSFDALGYNIGAVFRGNRNERIAVSFIAIAVAHDVFGRTGPHVGVERRYHCDLQNTPGKAQEVHANNGHIWRDVTESQT